MKKTIVFLIAVTLLTAAGLVQAHWDPADGHKMHNPQLPDLTGWDICLNRIILADDFQCSGSGPITDIHFWISWKDNLANAVNRWQIWIYSDLDGKPGQPLWQLKDAKFATRMMEPSPQGWICPLNNEVLPDNHKIWAQINVTEIADPFVQTEGKTYWLVLHAPMPIYLENTQLIAPPQVGWKTSRDHWGSPLLWKPWPSATTDGPEFDWRPLPVNMVVDGAFVINGSEHPPVREWDFGDAPEIDPRIMSPGQGAGGSGSGAGTGPILLPAFDYPTTLLRDGARHLINRSIFLGNPLTDNIQIDAEPDGQPNLRALGDDETGVDDEQAIIFPDMIWAGREEKLVIWASVKGYLNAWIDFNADGDWDDAGEQIFVGEPLDSDYNVRVAKILDTYTGGARSYSTYARFRFSTQKYLGYSGPARDGEVEDYAITIQATGMQHLDFGDADETKSNTFPTTLIRNGARHKVSENLHLGRLIDIEKDGQPSANAQGDDLSGLDDEEGVFFDSPLISGETAKLRVIATAEGYFNGWIDFDTNGDWDGAAEQIFTDQKVVAGVNLLTFVVPELTFNEAVAAFARFRLSTQAGLTYKGLAQDGEVEDYLVKLIPIRPKLDFGDALEGYCQFPSFAPCDTYPTTLARNGARHIINPEVYLGRLIDAELDGQPSVAADGDDTNGLDDEDGVRFVTPLVPGFPAKIAVQASVEGRLDGWIDFNGDGDWDDSGEQIFASETLTAGANSLKFEVPDYPDAIPAHRTTYARFRFNTKGGLKYTGLALDGEVEDYAVRIVEAPERAADLGDAPDSSNSFGQPMVAYPSQGMLPVVVPAHFPTVYRKGSPPFGPIHRNPEKVAYLGQTVTLEQEADYGFDADGVNNIVPLKELKNLDKGDDGIALPLVLPQNRPTRFDYLVTVIEPVRLLYANVWFDWNRDGDWDDTFNAGQPNEVTRHRGWVREWAVRNQVICGLQPGEHSITTPWFMSRHPQVLQDGTACPVWMRITLAEKPWEPAISPASLRGTGGSGPARGYWIGETEDYYFAPIVRQPDYADLDGNDRVDMDDLMLFVQQWLTQYNE